MYRENYMEIAERLKNPGYATERNVAALGTNANAPIDIKKDRPKDYRPVTTTLQRQRETYLGRLGLRDFRVTIDELLDFDDLETPTFTASHRSEQGGPFQMLRHFVHLMEDRCVDERDSHTIY
jgi:hypothetical protein